MINRGRIGFQEGGNPRYEGYKPEQISFDDWLKGKISGGSNKYGYLKDISKKYGYNLADALDLLYKYEIEHPKNLLQDPNYTINRLDGEDFYKIQFKNLEESGVAAQQNPEQEKYMLEQGYDAILKNYGLLDSTPEVPTVDPFSGQPVSAQDQSSFVKVGGESPEDWLKENPGYIVSNILPDIGGVPYFEAYKPEIPTVDPFSGEQVSAQDQAAFTQPQADIFPEQSRGLDYLTGMPDSQPVSQLGRQGILNLLTSNFGDLDFQTINELRNNPDAFNLSRGSGALTMGSLLPKFIKDFQYAAPQGTDIDQLRNLARETASNKSFTDLIKDVYNDPDKFDSDFKPKKAGQIKTGYPQYLKEGILSAVGFQPTSQIGGGTDAARALLEKIKSIPGAQTLGKVLPGVGIASGTYDVGSRLSQGDYFGAGLGALSAVPFVGIPAAAAQAAYDYRQPIADMIRNVVYRPGRG